MIEYKSNKNLPILKKNWKGNTFVEGRFSNGDLPESPPLLDVLKWKFSRNPQKAEKQAENYQVPFVEIKDTLDDQDKIVWLGHASFLITIGGKNIITDPCWFDLPMIKRHVKLPLKIENLPNIDYLLLSHDHRDHFDHKTLDLIIQKNPNVEALMPLNLSRLFKSKAQKKIKFQEAGWYQAYKLNEDFRIIFLPAKHWGRRGPFDFNQYLWGSFLIISGDKKIFFAGDSAYDELFKDIQSEFGDFDTCLMPIGAYAPKFMMQDSHMTPEEAFQAFNDLGGKELIPMHYGAFDLSDEPMGEPIRRLRDCFNDDDLRLKDISVGEIFPLQ